MEKVLEVSILMDGELQNMPSGGLEIILKFMKILKKTTNIENALKMNILSFVYKNKI